MANIPPGEAGTTPAGIGFYAVDMTAPWERSRVPVVFQHGLGLDARSWTPWMRRMLSTRPVVSIDLRGHGDSRDAWQSGDVGMDDYVADLVGVLDQLGIAACHYVGESFGGTMGLRLAAEDPERVRTLTVASTGWTGDLIQTVDEWGAILARPGGVAAWCEIMTQASLDADQVDPSLLEWVHRSQCDVLPEVVASIVRCLRTVDLTADLERITAPVLNLVAKKSPFVADRQHRMLRERVGRCDQIDFWDARHRLFLTHADICVTELQSFLARQEPGIAG